MRFLYLSLSLALTMALGTSPRIAAEQTNKDGAAATPARKGRTVAPEDRSVPEPPAPPADYSPPTPPDRAAQELEPEITITTKGTEIHEEYRVNGRLYMIKVIPAKGKPYYLIDYTGEGTFRRSDLAPAVAIPNWVIKSW